MSQEKRKDKRIKEDFSILCKTFRKTTLDGHVSRIIDISKSGMAFFTDNQLLKDDVLQIIFRLPPDFKEKVDIFGRVLECLRDIDGSFRTRIVFIDINLQAKDLLGRLIEQTRLKEPFKRGA